MNQEVPDQQLSIWKHIVAFALRGLIVMGLTIVVGATRASEHARQWITDHT